MKNKIIANLALFITAMLWGLSFVAQRAGMEYIGPFTFNMIRSILGGLSLIPVILFVKVVLPDKRSDKVKKAQHINLTRAGIGCGLALFAAMTIQQYGMQYVGAGKGGFISALYIIFVPILSVLYGERLSRKIVLSVLLALIGLYLLCYKSGVGFDISDLILLVGAFFYAVHIIVVNYYSNKVNSIKASCAQFFVVAILSGILVLLFETPTWDSIVECRVPLLYAGILTCGVAYTLQIFGQKNTLPVIASLIFCLESVFAVIGGVLILNETMSVKEILGCLFMISGVILSNINVNEDTKH
ncbi:DMT family transporter [bacterium]|nr:DMT family transporter [bacterium]